MKKLALIALLLCVGVVAGCSPENKGTGTAGGSAAPAATGSAS